MAEDGLGLHLEHLALVLEIEIWGQGGNPVGNLYNHIYRTRIISFKSCSSQSSRLDAQKVGSYAGEEAVVALEGESKIHLRNTGILDIVSCLSIRSLGKILHLPESGCREHHILAEGCVCEDLRSTAEGIERSTGLKAEYVWLVGSHRMPGLADFQCHGNRSSFPGLHVIPTDSHVCLTQTKLGRSIHRTSFIILLHCSWRSSRRQSSIKVSLDFSPKLGAAKLIACHIHSQTAGEREETERCLRIEVFTVGIVLIVKRSVVEQVSCTSLAFPCIESEIVPYETVKLDIGRFLDFLSCFLCRRLCRHPDGRHCHHCGKRHHYCDSFHCLKY